MQWTTITGRVVKWQPGEPWPTQTPEETALTFMRQDIEARGGYWCSDGEHYTFNWRGALSYTCCTGCAAAVDAYCDRLIG